MSGSPDSAPFVAALEQAVWQDIRSLGQDMATASLWEELAVWAVSLRVLRGHRVHDGVEAVVKAMLGSEGGVVEHLDLICTEDAREFVADIVGCILGGDFGGRARNDALQHLADYLEWGLDDEVVGRLPLTFQIVADDISAPEHAGWVLGLAVLRAFGEIYAAPSSLAKLALIRASAPVAGEVRSAVDFFLCGLCETTSFMELAFRAAQTHHAPLLNTFAELAPPRAVTWLAEALAEMRSAQRGPASN